jgi:DNA polymerase-1
MPGTLLLIDGSALAHRSYFAFVKNPLYNSRGENTGAVFGYTNSLLKILEKYEPSHVAVCFDTAAPTFRHQKYADYKATREKMDPEMRCQMPTIYEVTDALGVSVVELEGYEADDIMGTLATKAEKRGYSTLLVSGDKDFLQLVSDKVRVMSPGRTGGDAVLYDSEKVIEKFDVPPDKVADVLALAGDKVDNVPGVQGIGPKGAARLIQDFGSVEELLRSSSKIRQMSLREKIKKSKEELLVYKELVKIKTDAPVDLDVSDLERREGDAEKLRSLFRRLEFFSLMKKLEVSSETRKSFPILDNPGSVEQMLPKAGIVGLYACRARDGFSGGIAISGEGDECGFIVSSLLRSSKELLDQLRHTLSSKKIMVIAEDVKEAVHLLRKWGIELNAPFMDVALASYLIEPDRGDHGVGFHMEKEFGLSLPEFPKKVRGGRSDPKLLDTQSVACACSRADCAIRLKDPLIKRLKEDGLWNLYEDVELPLVKVLADMEQTGVLIDSDFFREMSARMNGELEVVEEEVYELAGERFNIRSAKQLATILFDKLGLPYGRKTKTGYSTSQDLLERLSVEHELPASVLRYREIYKLKSTYVDVLPGLVSPDTGRVHTTFNQTVAATGRLSSSEPNIQNIPMRTETGREIRKGFIAGEGRLLLSLDYSQVELRILAHLTGEESLIEAFGQGRDIHTETAAILFGVTSDDVTAEMRNTAKMVNYGLVYGMSSYGLSRRLSIPQKEAQCFMDAYFAGLPRVKSWIDQTVASAQEEGYTTTILGRRRYYRDISSRDASRREFAVRAAINSPIQGSAADMIKTAMVSIHGQLLRAETGTRMIMQIHDELLFEVPDDDVERVRTMARQKMVEALDLIVPVEVETGCGKDWYTAHK